VRIARGLTKAKSYRAPPQEADHEVGDARASLRGMRLALGIVLLGTTAGLSGCGASERQEVQAKVEQFVTATANHDYRALCDEVLAPSLLSRLSSTGIGCERAMQIFVGSVHDPTLSIARITVSGRNASAIALTAAQGQRADLEAIKLVMTGKGWRVSSLGSPASAPARSAR
jgi:hypothetical protein